jgi:hypothetical protein
MYGYYRCWAISPMVALRSRTFGRRPFARHKRIASEWACPFQRELAAVNTGLTSCRMPQHCAAQEAPAGTSAPGASRQGKHELIR